MNLLENLRKKVSKLSLGVKFIVRILYPVTLYLIFFFLLHINLRIELQNVQFVFIILWLLIEWQIFFKKPQEH
ncbi:hypothetical protein [Brumimicrobium oceani]|uniref:Uncharacterized protein n=1 Tax=Brumimicrobium oceani TaxID=2100725 RepID=A0A2U2XGP0_9FLAO|nr:hypothetical protein [Brumimicrobium oceani]PWH86917.1 hypothetical protein DIT68_01260 [Brumimicrobium oceani]